MCPSIEQLEAFHDRQVDESSRLALEAHVAQCPACAAELARLSARSALLQEALPPVPLLPIARHRLHAGVDQALEQGLVRLGWALSGIAAGIVLAGSIWLSGARQQAPQAPPPWVAVGASMNADPVIRDAQSPVAQWYLADASSRSDRAAEVEGQ